MKWIVCAINESIATKNSHLITSYEKIKLLYFDAKVEQEEISQSAEDEQYIHNIKKQLCFTIYHATII